MTNKNNWDYDKIYRENYSEKFDCIVRSLIELYKITNIVKLQNKACLVDKIICYWDDYSAFHPLLNQDAEFTYACIEFEYRLKCLRLFINKIHGQQITVMEIAQFGSYKSEIFKAVSQLPSLVYHIANSIDQKLKEKFITKMHEYVYQAHQTNARKINIADKFDMRFKHTDFAQNVITHKRSERKRIDKERKEHGKKCKRIRNKPKETKKIGYIGLAEWIEDVFGVVFSKDTDNVAEWIENNFH